MCYWQNLSYLNVKIHMKNRSLSLKRVHKIVFDFVFHFALILNRHVLMLVV